MPSSITKNLAFALLLISPSIINAQWTIVGPGPAYSEGPILNQEILFHPESNELYVAFYDFDLEFNNVGHISMMKWDGDNWDYIGPRMFTQEDVNEFSGIQQGLLDFEFNPVDNSPVIATRRVFNQDVDGASVLTWNGGSWEQLGEVVIAGTEDGSGFSGTKYSMDINPFNGQAAISYQDANNGGTSVLSFSSSEWGPLGLLSFTDLPSTYNSIAFHPVTGEAYVMNDSNENGFKKVQKFNGALWEEVGGPEVSESVYGDNADQIIFNPVTNEPYVVYFSLVQNPTASVRVKKFDGDAWVNVGENQEEEIWAFNPGIKSYSMKFHPISGEPYLIFADGNSNSYPSVYRFDGTNWVMLGSDPVFNIITNGLDLAFHPVTGVPYACGIDLSGKGVVLEYTGPMTGIAGINLPVSTLTLGPNPANHEVRLMTVDLEHFELLDLNGRQVYTSTKNTINLQEFNTGVYIVKAFDRAGTIQTQRLVIE